MFKPWQNDKNKIERKKKKVDEITKDWDRESEGAHWLHLF